MEFRSADPTFIGTIDAVFESKAITLMRTARAAVPALAVALALFGRASIVVAEPVQTGHVTAELVAEQDALVPGTTATVALRLAIEHGMAHVLAQSRRIRAADIARLAPAPGLRGRCDRVAGAARAAGGTARQLWIRR